MSLKNMFVRAGRCIALQWRLHLEEVCIRRLVMNENHAEFVFSVAIPWFVGMKLGTAPIFVEMQSADGGFIDALKSVEEKFGIVLEGMTTTKDIGADVLSLPAQLLVVTGTAKPRSADGWSKTHLHRAVSEFALKLADIRNEFDRASYKRAAIAF